VRLAQIKAARPLGGQSRLCTPRQHAQAAPEQSGAASGLCPDKLLAKERLPPILANSFMATAETKDIQSLQMHERDTGSADVQIALLTQRINQLTEHLKAHAKDHSSRRGLLMMVARRRRLLDYLKDTATDRYKTVLEKLNLRK
jgi:small subunit ribosomal protein S15